MAVFDFTPNGMELVELQEGVTLQEVREKTEAYYTVKPNIFETLKSEK